MTGDDVSASQRTAKISMNRCVILAIGIACLLAASSVAEEPPGAGSGRPASEANREAGLPDGTIREGTLGKIGRAHV